MWRTSCKGESEPKHKMGGNFDVTNLVNRVITDRVIVIRGQFPAIILRFKGSDCKRYGREVGNGMGQALVVDSRASPITIGHSSPLLILPLDHLSGC